MRLVLAIILAFTPNISSSADFSDPTWPCVQRKVERLSVGIMWPQIIDESPIRDEIAQDSETLSDQLVLRRISVEETEPLIAAFVKNHDNISSDDLGKIFRAVFNRIALDRSNIINGIGKYSLSQLALSEQIENIRIEMDKLMAKDDPDFDKVDALEETLDWNERIYRDRVKSLTYVCETPVLLEQRLFSIAQTLLKYAPE